MQMLAFVYKGASLLCSIVWVLADLLDGYKVTRPFLFYVRQIS